MAVLMADRRRALVQFTKTPRVGQVKTRLSPPLTPQQATAVHIELLLRTCKTLCCSGLGRVCLWVDDVPEHPVFAQCRALGVHEFGRQCGADLGQRMLHALDTLLLRASEVVLVGSDCPWLDTDYLERAFKALQECDVVLGPAEDGGYVLIAARRIVPAVFLNIPWSTDAVLQTTERRLESAGLSWERLPALADVDYHDDWLRWCRQRQSV